MGDVHDRASHRNCALAPDSNLAEVPSESLRAAEEETQRIIRRIQPTLASEGRRRDVVDYVQRLIERNLGHKVFTYGSVPLKTYLPDGDIDLTAFGTPNMEEILAGDIRAVLEMEENNKNAEFEVRDVQYINAEVKLVKCLVQNIVLDISFNQIGGLCTLYFLEKVNTIIGKDNLFKRSIILIKAWCYYESRILGAHHALISTYALETLILYIFHLFHSSLDSPLSVLYKFLDYFSKFDWDNYCVSLHGPVHVSSLPQIIAEVPENDGDELLLSKEFLTECRNLLPYFQRAPDPNYREFIKKHLNIVDPLKENNNLGRSVSKGNFHRIRSAFSYGARKLGRILLLPKENMRNDLDTFFGNTLERHGDGDRPDVRGARSVLPGKSPGDLTDVNCVLTDLPVGNIHEDSTKAISFPSHVSWGNSTEKVVDGSNVPYIRIPENGKLTANKKTSELGTLCPEASKNRYTHASLLFCEEDGKIVNGDYCNAHHSKQMESDVYKNGISQQLDEIEPADSRTSHSSTSSLLTSQSTSTSDHTNLGISLLSNDSDAGNGNFHDVSTDANELADLSGDLAAYYDNLLSYAHCSSPSFHFQGSNMWGRKVLPHMNGIVSIPPFPVDHSFHKNRGTGTFFPNMNYRQFRNRYERGRNTYPNHNLRNRSNRLVVTHHVSGSEEMTQIPSHRHPTVANDHGRSGMLESSETPPTVSSSSQCSMPASSPQFQIAFGSFGPVSMGDVNLPSMKNADTSTVPSPSSMSMYSSVVQKPSIAVQEGIKLPRNYKLKDEGDFPSLTGRGSPSSPAPIHRHNTVWGTKGGRGI